MVLMSAAMAGPSGRVGEQLERRVDEHRFPMRMRPGDRPLVRRSVDRPLHVELLQALGGPLGQLSGPPAFCETLETGKLVPSSAVQSRLAYSPCGPVDSTIARNSHRAGPTCAQGKTKTNISRALCSEHERTVNKVPRSLFGDSTAKTTKAAVHCQASNLSRPPRN